MSTTSSSRPPQPRAPLNITDRSLNFEATAFTQHEKLLWITEDRINKFLSNDEWTDANLSNKRIYFDKCTPINIEVYSPDPKKELRPLFKTVMQNATWKKTKIGESFGPSWTSHWFKLTLKPKDSWDENAEIHLIWNSKYVCSV